MVARWAAKPGAVEQSATDTLKSETSLVTHHTNQHMMNAPQL
jgi:hypothetical protein